MSQIVVNAPSASASEIGSPSSGVSNVAMPSLFQFSVIDAAFAVHYSKDVELEDGVMDNPLAKVGTKIHSISPPQQQTRSYW